MRSTERGVNETDVSLAMRIAVVETKVNQFSEELMLTRLALQGIHEQMLKFVESETQCGSALGTIIIQQSDLTLKISALSDTVNSLVILRAQVEGGWKVTVRFSALIAAAVAAGTALVAWGIEYLAKMKG